MITTEQVKELRDETGVSIMQCKKALEEAAGDKEKALIILKQKSSDIAQKKADRATNSGSVTIRKEGNMAAVVVLRCETDFVAKNDDFQKFSEAVAQKALADGKESAQVLAEEKLPEVIQKIGENIQIDTIETFTGPVVGAYEHHGEQGAIVVLSGGNDELARDIAMHIAAMKPQYATSEEIPADAKEKAQELFSEEAAELDKPEEIKEKIIEGKVDTYFNEQTLTEQKFIKNPERTIGKLLDEAGVHVVEFQVYNR